MSDSLGDAAQIRRVAEQVGEAAAAIAVHKLVAEHPDVFRPKPEIPAPLKWASVIISALFVMGVGATASWLVSTTNQTQLTVGRIDERIRFISEVQSRDVDDLKRRVDRLENDGGG